MIESRIRAKSKAGRQGPHPVCGQARWWPRTIRGASLVACATLGLLLSGPAFARADSHADAVTGPANSQHDSLPTQNKIENNRGTEDRTTPSKLERYNYGLLWKIEHPTDDVAPAYLFGTIHVSDRRVLDLPREVDSAFRSARSYSMEVKADTATMLQMSARFFYAPGSDKNLRNVCGTDTYELVRTAMRGRGLPDVMVLRLKPWAAMLLMSQQPVMDLEEANRLNLDSWLYNRALREGKSVHALETIDEHLSGFENLTDEEQVLLLRKSMRYGSDDRDAREALIQMYLQREIGVLIQSDDESGEHSERFELNMAADDSTVDYDKGVPPEQLRREEQAEKKLHHTLVVERNAIMVRAMQNRLAEGGAFVAVGAAHLPGEAGMLHLLEQQGYRLTRVY
ncbi:MAG: TraB/GumN family protein [Leptospiraceae bacterium]|nr:TraB/GumN family protein [Leptospiraceae bacterium]